MVRKGGLGRRPAQLAIAVALLALGAFPSAAAALDTAPDPTITVSTTIPAQQTGSSYTGVVATFFASNAVGGAAITIDWGDGTPLDTSGTNSSQGCQPAAMNGHPVGMFGDCPAGEAPTGTISGAHTFARPGPYTIVVTLSGTWGYVGGGQNHPFEARSSSGQGTIPAASSSCPVIATLGFAKLQLLGSGCVTTNGTRQTTPPGVPVVVNGLELHPDPTVSLTLDSAGGTLSSGGGNVTMDLGCARCGQHQTQFKPQPISWRVVPNPGEASIDEGSTGRFAVPIGGLLLNLPLLSLNTIKLTQDQSNVSFTVGVPIPSIAKFFGTIKATATMLSDNVTGARFDGLDAEIGASQKPELSGVTVTAPFKAFFGHLQFQLSSDTWNVSLTFDVPGAGGISASTQIIQGTPTAVHFAASYLTPGLAIGDTGAFLQGIDGGFTNYPTYSRPKIGRTQSSGNANTDAARTSECANINQYYDQYIALNQAFPSYCGQVGVISFDPPLEVDGSVRVSAGPVIASKSALIISGGFRYVDSYFDGSNNVPWAFNVQGGVTMLGLPFNRTTQQVYPNSSGLNKSSYVPINNAGKQAWAAIHGDGLVEAGGGFDYAFPQATDNWFLKITGDVGLSLIPKGAAIGAPPPGATPEQYANVVQSHANNWAAVGTITGSICAQIPTVASACATGAAGISNIGVAGCASFTVPGSQVLQTIARAGAAAINAIAAFGQQASVQVAQTAVELGNQAAAAAAATAAAIQSTANSVANGATQVANQVGSGITSAANTFASWFSRDLPATDVTASNRARAALAPRPLAHTADVVNANITIPDVNFAIGALYRWSNGSTSRLTSCSHDTLLSVLSAHDLARASAAHGVPSLQVRVGKSGTAPRIFVLTGVTASPDVIVMGPDRRAIRTKGPGFVEPGWIVYKDPKHKTTYVDAVSAPAGKWDFVAVRGSSRIANVQTAVGVTIPTVRGGIQSAKHGHYAILYRVFGRPAGDKITLEETDGAGKFVTFATLRRNKGLVAWRPSARLPGARRLLIAVIKRGSTTVSAQPLATLDLKAVAKHKPKAKPKPKPERHKKPEPPGDASPDHPSVIA